MIQHSLPSFLAAIFAMVFLLSCGDQQTTQESSSSTVQATQDKIELFNHKNLEGWYTWLKERGKNSDPDEVFSVEDGILHISGKEWGCITTEKEYDNYLLIAEYKWGENTYEPRKDNARDGGILVHSVGSDGDYSNTWMYSIECQIIEGGTGDFLVVGDKTENYSITSPVAPEMQGSSHLYQPGGELVTKNSGRVNWFGRDPNWQDIKGFRGPNDIEKPVGEWNKMECIVKGDTIIQKLNGVVVNEAYDVRPLKGRIQIQTEGAEMFFRKIDMIPL